MAIELIKISEFPQVSEPGDWIVVSDAAGTGYKISKEDFKEWLGTVTVITDKTIALADPAPTMDGVYLPTEAGTYTNAGGLVYDPEGVDAGKYVQFIKNDTVWTKLAVEFPLPENKIEQWEAGTYNQGDQRVHNGQIWSVAVPSTTQEPGTGGDWRPIAADYQTQEVVEQVVDIGTNIFDKSTVEASYFNASGDRINSTTTMSVLIPLSQTESRISINNSYFVTGAIPDKAQFQDAGGNIVEVIPNQPTPVAIINKEIPAGARGGYLALNIVTQPSAEGPVVDPTDNKYVNDLMVNYGAIALPYEPFGAQVKQSALIETNNRINEVEASVNAIGQPSPNLIDKSKIVFGRYNDTTGVILSSATTIRTPLIPYDPLKGEISYNSNANLATTIANRIFYFDENKEFISAIGKEASTQGLTPPANTRFIAANVTTQSTGVITDPTDNIWVNNLQMEYAPASTSYKPYGVLIDSSRIFRSETPIEMEIIDAENFIVHSLHDNGETVQHVWKKNNRTIVTGQPPHLDDSWQATQIIYRGDVIVQGSFNWIHVVNKPNESGQHVGTGHGAEELLSAHFYVDGNEIVIGDNIGNTIQGDVFTFDIQNRIAAVDQAATTNPSDVVIQLDVDDNPVWSTMHYMHGFIKGNSFHGFDNKLRILRADTSFVTCYLGMHNTYPVFWDKIQVMNGENSINDIATLTPIAPSTASLSGYTYNMADGGRGELANVIRSYSDNGWIFETKALGKDNDVTKKITMYINATSKKAYVQPVITTEIASSRGIPLDVFQIGDVIEGRVERSLIL